MRTCHYCWYTAHYGDFPDGSVVYLGICACAKCLESGKADSFKELIEQGQTITKADSHTVGITNGS